ncbi:MAG: hypothetical protein R2911_17800 [Caldilineaceae bacterium]
MRAVEFLYGIGWVLTGDDEWQVWLINHAYGVDYATRSHQSCPAKTWAGQAGLIHKTVQRPVKLPARIGNRESKILRALERLVKRVASGGGG